jgi:hypothetical protein
MRVSIGLLVLGAVASCYGTPRSDWPEAGVGTGGTGGTGGPDGSDDGGLDAAPVPCNAGSPCPSGTICGPANLCVHCSAVTTTLPDMPALRRPMRGAYTGSLHAPPALATLRPTFSWAVVAPTCGQVTYQVQADDSCSPGALDTCTFPSPEFDATAIATTSYAPSSDLKVSTTPPVGKFYAWRVRACDASARCGPWSEVRYLQVGRVREDINGDGYGDLLALSNRGIEIYLGASQFNPSDASHTFPLDVAWIAPTFSGDVNADGYGDFFGGTLYTPTGGAAPTIYFGGPDVTAPTTLILTKTAGGPSTLMQTNTAGDMNGDGFADVIVQWGYGTTTPQTELRIFFGGPTIANTPDLAIPGPYTDFYTLQHSGRVGDLNGDGFEDIALTALSNMNSNGGMIQVFTGGRSPVTNSAANVATTAATYQIEAVGDLDGDGYDDAIVILAGTGYYLYKGAAALATTLARSWADSTAASAVGGFDIDRDGFPDFAVGTSARAPILYRGSSAGPIMVSGALSSLITSTIIAVTDHDGDGRPDFVGTSGKMEEGSLRWAGSDGTTNPRAFDVRLADVNAHFSGLMVR